MSKPFAEVLDFASAPSTVVTGLQQTLADLFLGMISLQLAAKSPFRGLIHLCVCVCAPTV